MAQEPLVTFIRAHRDAIAPIPADKSALGTLPAAAFQYCEAIRAASSLGWYVFPPFDISFLWDGQEAFIARDGQWQQLVDQPMPDGFHDDWNAAAPDRLRDRSIAGVSATFAPGQIQIWSGLLARTAPGWSLLIRPLVNVHANSSFAAYEGLVESDDYGPFPLFTNVRLLATHREIFIPREKPLFQVQAVHRESYAAAHRKAELVELADMSAEDWAGYEGTIREPGLIDPDHEIGQYGASVRKRAKSERKP
ncbi:MAG: DUF6065 family protein [Rubricella sp.]